MSRFVRGESGGELRRLKRTAWSHQRTFVTPLNDLPRFVGKLLGGIDGLRAATAHIELVVFEPKALQSLVGEAERAVADGDSIRTEGAAGASDLLGACLACWGDFWFVPEPKPLVIYADHDELTTLLGMRAAGVNRAAERLEASGFAELRGLVRK